MIAQCHYLELDLCVLVILHSGFLSQQQVYRKYAVPYHQLLKQLKNVHSACHTKPAQQMKQRKKVKNFLLTYQSQFTKKARKIVAGK